MHAARSNVGAALFGIGAAALLLFIGIHNARDAVTYHIFFSVSVINQKVIGQTLIPSVILHRPAEVDFRTFLDNVAATFPGAGCFYGVSANDERKGGIMVIGNNLFRGWLKIAAGALMAAAVSLPAFATPRNDLRADRRDIRQDTRDIRHDRRDLRNDQKHPYLNRKDIRADKRDLRKDKVERRHDLRDLHRDGGN